jgi:hypothetical protein
MISSRLQLRACFIVVLPVMCAACERAPSIDVIGSFFPVWMLCLSLGVALAFVARYFLMRYQLESAVGPLALFYPSVTILSACLLWLVFFR